ncbi:MAG: carbamoyltransferase, partial [Deltaproteobacteria bacterium]
RLKTFTYPNSLGLFYSVMTEYLGFGAYDGEYMVMGLAPYGKRNPEILEIMSKFFEIGDGDYRVDLLLRNPVFFDQAIEEVDRWLHARRERSESAPITEKQKDIAWALQHMLEETVLRLVARNHEATGSKNLCLAGGVALNCKMNKRLVESEFVENIFVQPASGDDGLAIGTAQVSHRKRGVLPRERLDHVYFGPGYTNDEIRERLEKFKLHYETLSDSELIEKTARLLADDKLVGWFQGRMEFGPRALGNRSILASPMKPEMKDLVNDIVKRRDGWRPFAPVVMEEKASEYFVNAFPSPFMTITFDVRPEARAKIPAVTHVDGTARIQTVNARQNRRYYDLLAEFERLTGCAVLLNTSFNLKGEPIVNTPEDAIVDFFRSGLDVLAIGNFLLHKG